MIILKEKKKKERKPSKFRLWHQKMKSTPKGRAYLKLIYWGIFFLILFIFLAVASSLSRNYETPIVEEEEPLDSEEVEVVKTIDTLQEELLNSTYHYEYHIEDQGISYLFEGTKYDSYEEGYKNYSGLTSGVIRYYIDATGVYQVNGEERVAIDDFYQGLETNFLDLSILFRTINALTLTLDSSYDYPVYIASDANYQYMLNISPDGLAITDISVVSVDGNTTYLLSFKDVGEI